LFTVAYDPLIPKTNCPALSTIFNVYKDQNPCNFDGLSILQFVLANYLRGYKQYVQNAGRKARKKTSTSQTKV